MKNVMLLTAGAVIGFVSFNAFAAPESVVRLNFSGTVPVTCGIEITDTGDGGIRFGVDGVSNTTKFTTYSNYSGEVAGSGMGKLKFSEIITSGGILDYITGEHYEANNVYFNLKGKQSNNVAINPVQIDAASDNTFVDVTTGSTLELAAYAIPLIKMTSGDTNMSIKVEYDCTMI
ncbi:hypothetical protein [Endozoicomonas sp. ALB032]|uniref:hypothetical protein n=1 Tax=Endozoicomonas sp. ALB032 TaxID=3403082 RepID=UPI003BB6BE47